MYSDSSEFVHSQFTATLMSSYTSKKGDDDLLGINLYGSIDSTIDRLLIRSIPFFDIFVTTFIKIINSKHNLKLAGENKEEGLKLFALMKIRKRLSIDYISSHYK